MMSHGEMEERKRFVLDHCICPDCPSWTECGESGGFCFQTIGKSGCIKEENGCICGGCPVKERMNLKNLYFCTRGSEKDQLEK